MSAAGAHPRALVRRWHVPRMDERLRKPTVDSAAQALELLGRKIASQIPRVLPKVASVSQSPVEKHSYIDDPASEDRAWRICMPQGEASCVIAAQSERVALSFILDAVPKRRLTEIERRIIGEAIARLIPSGEAAYAVREEPRARPVPPTWRCTIELRDGTGLEAELALYMACAPPQLPVTWGPSLHDVPMLLRAALPTVPCSLGAVTSWQEGSVVRLQRDSRGPIALLYAGGHCVARAQIGATLGQRALKLTELT